MSRTPWHYTVGDLALMVAVLEQFKALGFADPVIGREDDGTFSVCLYFYDDGVAPVFVRGGLDDIGRFAERILGAVGHE